MKYLTKSIFLSVGIIILLSIFEQQISGNGIEWFKTLDKPNILVSLNVFYLVAGILGLINIIVLTRLFNIFFETKSNLSKIAIVSVIVLTFVNVLWNYFFMGLENPRNGFIGILIFLPMLIITLLYLIKIDKVSFWLYSLYLAWILYDLMWTYKLWKLNPG